MGRVSNFRQIRLVKFIGKSTTHIDANIKNHPGIYLVGGFNHFQNFNQNGKLPQFSG